MSDVARRDDGRWVQYGPGGPGFSAFWASVDEPRIVLAALTRLRWMAVIAQLGATGLALAAWAGQLWALAGGSILRAR
jgi:hypothetical protein